MKRSWILPLSVFLVVFASSLVAFAAEKRIERRFETEPGKRLTLDIETGGEIDVVGWDSELIEVVVELDGDDIDRFEIDFDESSKGLKIETEYSKRNVDCDVTMHIKVPSRFDIEIGSLGGDLDIEGVEGEFSGKTMGGDIVLSRLSGRIELMTYGGDVDVSGSKLDGTVKTMGGDITITEVAGDIRGSSIGGEVTYDKVTAGGDEKDVSVMSMGGDISLDYAGKHVKAKTLGGDIDVISGEEVDVKTMGGDIDVARAPRGAKASTMGGDIHIESAGLFAKAKTLGGDIEIDAVDGWVEASTCGGDIYVTMVGDPDEGERYVVLESKGGDLELTVPAGLSMSFDVELAYTKGRERDYGITSDFDMDIERTEEWKWSWGQKKKYIYGTGSVGDGRNRIALKTTNGNIVIKRSE